jgi:hypothetical protein
MSIVATPIRVSVMTSVFLRPMRSPMWLKITPPIGRTTKASANDANVSIELTSGSSLGKKCTLKTAVAIVP